MWITKLCEQVIRKQKTYNAIDNLPQSRAPCKISFRGVKLVTPRLIWTMSKNHRTTQGDLMMHLQRAKIKATEVIISNTLRWQRIKSRSSKHVSLLNPVHVQTRLKFACAKVNVLQFSWRRCNWENPVIFQNKIFFQNKKMFRFRQEIKQN